MLVDDALVFGEIDAKRFVVGHEAFDPLNIRAELLQDLIRFCGGRAQLLAFERPDLGDMFSMINRRSAICHLHSSTTCRNAHFSI